jgi:hypothetical protein
MSMTILGIIRIVTAARISNKRATIGVAIKGNPIPVVPLTKAAKSKAIPTTIVVVSNAILSASS